MAARRSSGFHPSREPLKGLPCFRPAPSGTTGPFNALNPTQHRVIHTGPGPIAEEAEKTDLKDENEAEKPGSKDEKDDDRDTNDTSGEKGDSKPDDRDPDDTSADKGDGKPVTHQ